MTFVSILLIALAITVTGYLLLSAVVHRAYRAPRIIETGTPHDFALPYRTVSIATANAKSLFGWFVPQPQSPLAPGIVAIHGWGGNAEFMLPLAALMHRAGYAILLLDARNHGRSDTDTFSSLPRFAEDLEHGLSWLSAQPEVDPRSIVLLGHSVGAAAALLVASRRQDVAAVVSIAAFAHPEEMMRRRMQAHHIPDILSRVVLRYIERAIGRRYEDIAPVNTIRSVDCPVLLVHGCEDRRIPIKDAEAIYAQRAHKQVRLLALPQADHDFVEQIDSNSHALIGFLHEVLQGERGT